MVATSHVIIGGAAGVAVGAVTHSPALGLAAGIVSHFICDSIPHIDGPPHIQHVGLEVVWDKSLYIFAILDSLIAFFVVLSIWGLRDHFALLSMFAWGAGGGYLPDLLDNFPAWNRKLHTLPLFKQFHTFHFWIHENWRVHLPMPKHWKLGIATQFILVIPCLYYLLR